MRDFVGIPYVEGGRDYDGADCWGLVYLYFRDCLGIELPRFDDAYPIDDKRALSELIDSEKRTVDARPVVAPEDGDLVLMKFRGNPVHIGVYVDGGRVLHSMSGADSVLESVKAPRLRGRIEGFYRVA